MLSKNQIKIITSLKSKKHRHKYGLFVVEGKKSVLEFLNSDFELVYLFFTEMFSEIPKSLGKTITTTELKKISFLKTPNNILAVFKIPKIKTIGKDSGLIIALDNIKDPGNLGTIIRLCDWFGVTKLVCSKETVDCYNEKVIQASMGSLIRISIVYTDLSNYLKDAKIPVFATAMSGKNIYTEKLPQEAIIVLGNEANGISEKNLQLIQHKISIPKFGNLQQTESLNVAAATAIFLSEFKRST